MSKTIKKIKIHSNLDPINWITFHQIYIPILGIKTAYLYTSFFFQNQINKQLNIEEYDLDQFLQNYQFTEQEFNEGLKNLDALGIVNVFIKQKINLETEIMVKLNSIKSLKESFKDETINNQIKQSLDSHKYLELRLLTEDSEQGHEIDFDNQKEENINIIDKDTYCIFYEGVFKLSGFEFSLCDRVLELIKEYYIDNRKISLEKLQDYAYMSIKEKNGQKIIDYENFKFLIKQTLNSEKTVNSVEFINFWKEILVTDGNLLENKSEELFSSCNCESLYKTLTSKSKIPESLSKWIKDCIQNKGFSYPVLNAKMSFVNALIGKISVNYLIKVSDTLVKKKSINLKSFINHAKSVITNDLENGNDRLQVKTNKNKWFEKENNNELFYS